MFRSLGPPEIILILVVLVLLFGAKRLPDAARSLGRSMRIFKSEVKEMRGDDQPPAKPAEPRAEGAGAAPAQQAKRRECAAQGRVFHAVRQRRATRTHHDRGRREGGAGHSGFTNAAPDSRFPMRWSNV